MGAYLGLIGRGRGWGGHLFEAGRLLTFSTFRMGAYSNKYWYPLDNDLLNNCEAAA